MPLYRVNLLLAKIVDCALDCLLSSFAESILLTTVSLFANCDRCVCVSRLDRGLVFFKFFFGHFNAFRSIVATHAVIVATNLTAMTVVVLVVMLVGKQQTLKT